MGRWRVVVMLAAVTLAACSADRGGSAPSSAPHAAAALASVSFGANAVRSEPVRMRVEVADSDELRFCGLMHRRSMPDDHGMLFVFPADQTGPFWNRNTFIPLTLAWIAADGRIVDLTDLPAVKPEDDPQPVVYSGPALAYRFVIEANQGWYARNQVSIGDRVDLQAAVAGGSGGALPICREKGL